MSAESQDPTQQGYDRVADAYAAGFLDELTRKPLDRALLDLMVEQAAEGPIADLGCGPGHVARYLHDKGVPALGIDLSPRMVEIASETHPGIGFHVGDLRSLHVPDQAFAGLVAFYSIIHLPPGDLPAACTEFLRVLRPGGSALISFHLGTEVRHLDEWFDRIVSLDFRFYLRDTVEQALTEAGFVLDAYIERRAYEHEVDTTRAYLLASRPSPAAG